MLEIVKVHPEGIAAQFGLQSGDAIISVNNEEIRDVIDFQFSAAEEELLVRVRKADGRIRRFRIRKLPDDTLGLEFVPLSITRCRNRCIFCFVDQMPPGCRKTLYIKDDDFRASFLYGNFITLGALTEADWSRIFRQRLSPLYISVHATGPEIRASLLRNRKAPPILQSLERLAAAGIRMHTQIVLCPGINDGEHLVRTIRDLAGLFPAVSSIAVVPVGMTSFRRNLVPLKQFSAGAARKVISDVDLLAHGFQKQFGTRIVFASDEFYIKAGKDVPNASTYGDFPQIENGVGMVASFLRDVSRTRLPSAMRRLRASVVTGVSFSGILKRVLNRLPKTEGVLIRTVTATNFFFGPSVTVTGLLTGSDILRALKRKPRADVVIIPSNCVKEDEDVFLDGMSVQQLERALDTEIAIVDNFKQFVSLLRGERRTKR